MKEFMDIMQLMNNGLYNESTLKDSYPKIIGLCIAKNPDKLDYVTSWMLTEECFSNPHPGLDETVKVCMANIPTLEQTKIR